jgi:hypothetical protein
VEQPLLIGQDIAREVSALVKVAQAYLAASVPQCLHEWHKDPLADLDKEFIAKQLFQMFRRIPKTSICTDLQADTTRRHILQEGYEPEIIMMDCSTITLLTSSEPNLRCTYL